MISVCAAPVLALLTACSGSEGTRDARRDEVAMADGFVGNVTDVSAERGADARGPDVVTGTDATTVETLDVPPPDDAVRAADGADAPRMTDALEGRDTEDTGAPDALDALDAPDAPDTPDALDALDALDAPDAPDTPDTPDTPDALDAPDAMPLPPAPARYPDDRVHSPITEYVKQSLRDRLAESPGSRRDVFAKVGDSITVATAFLRCFAGTNVVLDRHAGLEPTRQHFLTNLGGMTSYDRNSLAAMGGRTAAWAVTGSPSPVEQELVALTPAFAVVMYGTNDIGWFAPNHAATTRWYGENMIALVDTILGRGTIPILMSIPPFDADADLDHWVPTFGALVRAIAQARQVPFVDYHRLLVALPNHGLSADGVHPNASPSGACVLTDPGLQYGYNVRNLATLEALDRVVQSVVLDGAALDPQTTGFRGDGSPSAPYEVDAVPFVHSARTDTSATRALRAYTGCNAAQNEAGPEVLYRWTPTVATRFRAVAIDAAGVDIDLHLLDATGTEAGCLARGDTVVEGRVESGTYYFALDTFVNASGVELSGEYFLAIVPCDAADARCDAALQ